MNVNLVQVLQYILQMPMTWNSFIICNELVLNS
jgi:hypothetical protein